MKLSELRKVELGIFPTPLYKLGRLSAQLKSNVFIKRDDLDGLGFGGNKLRKLEYLVNNAKELGYTTLLTFGGEQTNHGRQTAACACRYGLKSIIIVDMDSETPPERLSGNLLLDAILGCDIIFLDVSGLKKCATGESARTANTTIAAMHKAAAKRVVEAYKAKGERVYVIPPGASTPLGCMGYFFAIKEIMEQLDAMHERIDYVVCALGSAGTFAGLWLGSKYFSAPFQIIGIAVSPYSKEHNLNAARLINETSNKFELGIIAEPDELHINGEYWGCGYDTPDPQTYNTIYQLARTEGLFVDPIYTGKSFTGMLDLITKEKIPIESNVLFIHTGGTPALFSEHHNKIFTEELWNHKKHMVISPRNIQKEVER